jgi:hypothetical protein
VFPKDAIKQVPEFERCRYKEVEGIVSLLSVFDGAFANVKIKANYK